MSKIYQRFNVFWLVSFVLIIAVVGCSSDDSGESVVDSANNDTAEISPNSEAVPVSPAQEVVALPELISPADYQSSFADGDQAYFLLDVRTADEFNGGHIDGAYNISHEQLATRLDEVPTDMPVVLYCRSGNRSSVARDILRDAGYTNFHDIQGGIVNWTNQGYPVTR